MRRRSIVLAVLTLLGTIQCPIPLYCQSAPSNRPEAVSPISLGVVPFDMLGNAIVVHVRLNGHGPFAMLLDSGAVNFLSADLGQQLGATVTGNDEGVGIGQRRVFAEDVAMTSVEIGNVPFRNMRFHLISLPYVMEHGFPEPVVGGIGYELLKQVALRIDFDRKELVMWDSATFRYRGRGIKVPLVLHGHVPVVRGTVDGTSGDFEIDSGAEDSLSLNTPFVQSNDILHKYAARIHGFAGEGVGGRENAYFVRVRKFELGGVEVSSIVTELSQETAGATAESDISGLVGVGVLKRFNIVLDYGSKSLYLEPNANYKLPSVFNRAGFAPRITSAGLLVISVFPNTPASEAGIQPGDQIVSIDGRSGSELNVPFLFKVLRGCPGTLMELEILRNGVTQHYHFKLRDLV